MRYSRLVRQNDMSLSRAKQVLEDFAALSLSRFEHTPL
jgi:hypothetical protein